MFFPGERLPDAAVEFRCVTMMALQLTSLIRNNDKTRESLLAERLGLPFSSPCIRAAVTHFRSEYVAQESAEY